MERHRFAKHLDQATRSAIDLARKYVINELQGDVDYIVEPNSSCDDNLREGEVVFPDDSLADGAHHGPWAFEPVVEFLWRDAKVPEWIDIAVSEVPDAGGIHLRLRCCGRFTANEALLYYTWGDVPPFGIKSPVLPPGWAEDDKFDVNWHRERIAAAPARTKSPWWRFW